MRGRAVASWRWQLQRRTARSVATHQAGHAPGQTLKFSVDDAAVALGQSRGPLALYQRMVDGGQLRDDSLQRRVLEVLNAVYHSAEKRQARGLYLHGSVGCGKTMAMDLFCTSVQGSPKLRVERRHFHDFVNDVQVQLHRLHKEEGPPKHGNPTERVAHRIADRLDVLCFDELAITTIQDCCILLPLFNTLFQRGVLVVATSNRAPDDLYTDGLNRHLYLPAFLETLRANCKVMHLQSSTDYRTLHYDNSPDAGVYCWPADRSFVDGWFLAVAGAGEKGDVDISFGRSLPVPQLSCCGRVGRFDFGDLCEQHLSADDFMFLTRQFHTLLLDDVPVLTVDEHNEARRFTQLIDWCYEHHVRIICSMAAPPEVLLAGLRALKDMDLNSVGGSGQGCGDGDTSPSSSGVFQAVNRVKQAMNRHSVGGLGGDGSTDQGAAHSRLNFVSATEVLGAQIERVRSHGDKDMDVWRQAGDGRVQAPPQVSKSWDDRRRISAFTWESTDPTSEQASMKGVFAAAIASLKESGFAVDRAISRMKEMQTQAFQDEHRLKHGIAE